MGLFFLMGTLQKFLRWILSSLESVGSFLTSTWGIITALVSSLIATISASVASLQSHIVQVQQYLDGLSSSIQQFVSSITDSPWMCVLYDTFAIDILCSQFFNAFFNVFSVILVLLATWIVLVLVFAVGGLTIKVIRSLISVCSAGFVSP